MQRSLADWPVVLAALLLLICATTLLATGVVYGDAVAAGGLHRALLDEPASGRSVVVSLSADPAHLSDVDAVVRPALADAMATTGGDILRAVRTGSFAERRHARGPGHGSRDPREPRRHREPGDPRRRGLAAGRRHAHPGDDVRRGGRGPRRPRRGPPVARQPAGPGHARRHGHLRPLARRPGGRAGRAATRSRRPASTTGGTFTTRGPIVVREADLLGVAGSNRVDVEWRGLPDLGALRVADVDALRTSLTSLQSRLSRDLPAGAQSRVTTTLPDTLVEVGRSVLVSRSGIALVTIQFVILAGYAVLLVAGLLVERRRSEIALLRVARRERHPPDPDGPAGGGLPRRPGRGRRATAGGRPRRAPRLGRADRGARPHRRRRDQWNRDRRVGDRRRGGRRHPDPADAVRVRQPGRRPGRRRPPGPGRACRSGSASTSRSWRSRWSRSPSCGCTARR